MQPFILVVTAILGVTYAYLAARLAAAPWQFLALAVPVVMVWAVPVIYWGRDREKQGWRDDVVHWMSYVSMAWLSFVLVLALVRDAVLLLTAWTPALSQVHAFAQDGGVSLVYLGSLLALGAGMVAALRGPHVRHVDIAVSGLHPDLDGFRIAQISDLHVGLSIRRRYVERVVELTMGLAPDLVALTGDIVDGPVRRLAPDVASLQRLAAGGRAFFILGNHDCYSGAGPWMDHFRSMGIRVLANSHETVTRGRATMVVGGVVDPAARMYDPALRPRPDLAMAGSAPDAFKLLLAHNPKLAPLGAAAGFDLQLSGHTHAGQFFPWTIAIHIVHAPHAAGLSREGRMQVYVSAGTGTWGPPVRLGTQPELTLIRLVRAGAQ